MMDTCTGMQDQSTSSRKKGRRRTCIYRNIDVHADLYLKAPLEQGLFQRAMMHKMCSAEGGFCNDELRRNEILVEREM